MDGMDQTTMMALAATGVAVVGAAVMYATASNAPAPTKKKKSKRARRGIDVTHPWLVPH